jgi:hypothetical protein
MHVKSLVLHKYILQQFLVKKVSCLFKTTVKFLIFYVHFNYFKKIK